MAIKPAGTSGSGAVQQHSERLQDLSRRLAQTKVELGSQPGLVGTAEYWRLVAPSHRSSASRILPWKIQSQGHCKPVVTASIPRLLLHPHLDDVESPLDPHIKQSIDQAVQQFTSLIARHWYICRREEIDAHVLRRVQILFQQKLLAIAKEHPAIFDEINIVQGDLLHANAVFAFDKRQMLNVEELVLVYLHCILINFARYGDVLGSKKREQPIIIDGQATDFYVHESDGDYEATGATDITLFYDGPWISGHVQRRGSRLIAVVSYNWTPRGFVIERVQGEKGLLKILLPETEKTGQRRRLKNVYNHATSQLGADPREWLLSFVIQKLQEEWGGCPLYFRSPYYMSCAPHALHILKNLFSMSPEDMLDYVAAEKQRYVERGNSEDKIRMLDDLTKRWQKLHGLAALFGFQVIDEDVPVLVKF